MIRADLHVHTKISKGLPFRMSEFDRTVSQARKKGLNGFAAIEHFHAGNFWDTTETLAKRYRYSSGHFTIFPGFNVLSGAELTVADAADIVVLGPVAALMQFDRTFRPHFTPTCTK
jgi:predicted metal-dependent phosphoesterase TrpH